MNEGDKARLLALIGALQTAIVEDSADLLNEDPRAAENLVRRIADLQERALAADRAAPPPPDGGLAQLAGIGPEAASDLSKTRLPDGVEEYDESVAPARLTAMGDLYYACLIEQDCGVFRVVQKLQELFLAGAIYLSDGPGAYGLYRFDLHKMLRSTHRERHIAYKRAFGYGRGRRRAAAPA
jgi:hypothetical protein